MNVGDKYVRNNHEGEIEVEIKGLFGNEVFVVFAKHTSVSLKGKKWIYQKAVFLSRFKLIYKKCGHKLTKIFA